MTKQTEHRNDNANVSAEPTQIRLSKRETVAAFYERMLSGVRRKRGAPDQPATMLAADSSAEKSSPHSPADTLAQHGDPVQSEPDPVESEQGASIGPRSEMEWNDLISHRIEEAMHNGAFDNLRNKGKPLPQEYNPHVPEDRRMTNDLLKNNGLAPQWIGDRTAMLRHIDTFRAKFHEIASSYQTAWHANSTDVVKRQQIVEQWATQLETWQEELRLLNRRIDVVNLQQPIIRLEIFKLLLDEELKRVGMTRNLMV